MHPVENRLHVGLWSSKFRVGKYLCSKFAHSDSNHHLTNFSLFSHAALITDHNRFVPSRVIIFFLLCFFVVFFFCFFCCTLCF